MASQRRRYDLFLMLWYALRDTVPMYYSFIAFIVDTSLSL
jgi:hypothetical protein